MLRFSFVSAGAIGGAGEVGRATGWVAVANPWRVETIGGLKGRESLRGVWVRALLFAALFLVTMVAGIMLTRLGGPVSPVWLASAVLAWALIGASTRDWPVYLGCTAAAHAIGGALVGDSLIVESVYFVADFASPILLAALMRWRGDSLVFEHRGEVFRFLLIGGFLAPGVSAAIVALGTVAGLIQLTPISVATWYFAQALGFVVFLPLMQVVTKNGWRALLTPGSRRKTFAYFAILIAAQAVPWIVDMSGFRIFTLLLVPYLLLMTFELGLTAARAALALTAVSMMLFGLFTPPAPDRLMDPGEFLFAVQVYIAAMVASILPVAVVLAERQRLYETASQALHEAQEAWGHVLAAEARHQFVAQHPDDVVLHLGADGEILFASNTAIALRQGKEGLAGLSLVSMTHPDDSARVRDTIAALAAGGAATGFWQLRLRDMNDEWVLYDVDASTNAPGEIVAVLRTASE